MAFEGIIVGTLVLLGLQTLVVGPLTAALLRHSLALPNNAHLNAPQLSEEHRLRLESLRSRCFIGVDVVVLFVAGLVGGLMGYWFLGFAKKANAWPGMIAFVGASFLGLALRPGAGF